MTTENSDLYYKKVALAMVNAAKDGGYLEGALTVIEPMAVVEKGLFVQMFDDVRKYLKRQKRLELTEDEIVSLFAYVYAKAAEAVTNYWNNQPNNFDDLGMFDGKVPLYADDALVGYFKKMDFPGEMAMAFFAYNELDETEMQNEGVEPLLVLFEALKWTWRIAVHLAVNFLEDQRGCNFQEEMDNDK